MRNPVIMKCQADKSWLTEQAQSDETSCTQFKIAIGASAVFVILTALSVFV